MAIIYLDKFETTLAAAATAAATTIQIDPAVAARLDAAMGMPASFDFTLKLNVGATFLRLPLFIDNGTAIEQVEVTGVLGPNVTVVRAPTAIAWSSGATVRCAPPAGRVAAGMQARRAVAAAEAYAVPGEVLEWTPSGAYPKLKLAHGFNWSTSDPSFTGETWPAVVRINNGGVARTMQLSDYTGTYASQCWQEGASGMGAMDVALPATCKFAVLTIVKLPAAWRTGGQPMFTIRKEIYG